MRVAAAAFLSTGPIENGQPCVRLTAFQPTSRRELNDQEAEEYCFSCIQVGKKRKHFWSNHGNASHKDIPRGPNARWSE